MTVIYTQEPKIRNFGWQFIRTGTELNSDWGLRQFIYLFI